jgi:antitoxin PrlF
MRDRGQLTLPAPIREAAHLEPGDPVVFELVSEGILVRPQKLIDATQAWFWTASWQEGEAAASADIAAGRTTIHKSTEDFLASLDED